MGRLRSRPAGRSARPIRHGGPVAVVLVGVALAAAACSGGYEVADPDPRGTVPPVCADVAGLADALRSATAGAPGTPTSVRTPGTPVFTDDPAAAAPAASATTAPAAPPSPPPGEVAAAIDRLRGQVPADVADALAALRAGGAPGPAATPTGTDLGAADPLTRSLSTVQAWAGSTCGVALGPPASAPPTGGAGRGSSAGTTPAGLAGDGGGPPRWADIEAAARRRHPDAPWADARVDGTVGDAGDRLTVTITGGLGLDAARSLCDDVRAVLAPSAPGGKVVVVVKLPSQTPLAGGGPDGACTADDPLR